VNTILQRPNELNNETTYLVLRVLAISFQVLCCNLLLEPFPDSCVLISAGSFVFEATNSMREEVLLEKIEGLVMLP
jgi:hypothetical protein